MLVVKMDGNSRLAKQYRFANKAQELADRLERQERVHLVRNYVSNPNGRTDALGRVLETLNAKPTPGETNACLAVASYLGVEFNRLPNKVMDTLDALRVANDQTEGVVARRYAIATELRKVAQAVRNARIGR